MKKLSVPGSCKRGKGGKLKSRGKGDDAQMSGKKKEGKRLFEESRQRFSEATTLGGFREQKKKTLSTYRLKREAKTISLNALAESIRKQFKASGRSKLGKQTRLLETQEASTIFHGWERLGMIIGIAGKERRLKKKGEKGR